MRVKIEKGSITEYKCDLAVVNLFEKVKRPAGATGVVDKALGGLISKLIKSAEIDGKLGSCVVIHTYGKILASKVAVVGLGKQSEFNLDKIRVASAVAIRKAKEAKASKIATIIHGAGVGGVKPGEAAPAVVEGSIIGNYKFEGLKEKEDEFSIDELVIVEIDQQKIKLIAPCIERATLVSEAVNRARDLVNMPSNEVTPTYLAEYAKKVAKKEKISYEVLDLDEIKKTGLEAFYSVAKGSKEPAKLVVLKYKGKRQKAKGKKESIGLVGKGVTFDAGGISLKSSKHLADMKTDMAGAASIIEIMRLLSQLKSSKSVIAVLPLTENMPDGAASKPGDVVTSLSGKTIEIISTDAEGRLVLADAITYAKKLGVSKIIDVATLTAGCKIALGDVASGIMGTDRLLIDQLKKTSEETGEKVWELPLYEEYKDYLKSKNADILNCTEDGKASPCAGGVFLQRFAEGTPWVHIDIAGTAYLEKERGYLSSGATGVMVRTLAKILI